MNDVLTKILEKLDQLDKKVDTIGSEVREVRKEIQAHRMEIDDNFTKLYKLVEDTEVEIDLLNKRIFKNETTVEKLKRQKH
ncbi:TPA: hypothetical protein QCX45_005455 [Bacillus paranthracis]|nr:hypothetical protein [Bacillus paranthracis]HDR7477904.1 hypothetical protein [Bacillus paranthracis]